ncbi:MAG: 3-isopropylmalate dehydratase large subunit [Candidatus Thermoplasmatota archaeon]|nr:3-isopropylmalate dehydratase large subunit [Candidatus Thermoplasmatota archaeon]MBU4255935.1 3-isopropylmalate dehydratase large subunit [Candidatus Thermoplasmatota archaeon]MCG2827170.1 3-isopropylmalate dehydratase large subunit [Thermoplasmatales archaeon]
MSLTHQIINRKIGRKVEPGEIVECNVDFLMMHDGSAFIALKNFGKIGKKVFDRNKIMVVFDHYCPSNSIENSNIHNQIRKFVKNQGIKYFFDCGNGVCHQVFAETRPVKPYSVIVGGDSHTTTYGALGMFAVGMGATDIAVTLSTGRTWFRVPEAYRIVINGRMRKGVYAKDIILGIIKNLGVGGANYKSVEFDGSVVKNLSPDSRLTLCNMIAETGAKNGIIDVDEKTGKSFGKKNRGDNYGKVFEYESPDEPLVACPHSISNVKPVREVEAEIDQVFIGSCTNGRYEDMRVAANILRNRKVRVRTIISPASRNIYLRCLKDGFIKIFMQAGAIVLPPSCGPCMGVHNGVLGKDEVCLSTGNRNFRGRMGSGKIYLCSPATAASSAVNGKITDPRRYL